MRLSSAPGLSEPGCETDPCVCQPERTSPDPMLAFKPGTCCDFSVRLTELRFH